jgi:hypothetical protein
MKRQLMLFAVLLVSCSGPSGPSDARALPELGRYALEASWQVPGLTDPAVATGTLRITAAALTSIAYDLTLNETGGQLLVTGSADWFDAYGYVVYSASIDRAGPWTVSPYLKRAGSAYEYKGA